MDVRLLIPLAVAGAILFTACGGGRPSSSPSATTTVTRAPSTSPSPAIVAADDQAWFQGEVVDVVDATPTDGPLTLYVRVSQALGGGHATRVGEVQEVWVACGECVPCQGRFDREIDKGWMVEILAQMYYGKLTTCTAPSLFAMPLGPTPTPTPSPPPSPCATLVYPSGASPTLEPCSSHEPTRVAPTTAPPNSAQRQFTDR